VIGDWGLLEEKKDEYYDIFPLLQKRIEAETFAAFIFLGDMAYSLCDRDNDTKIETSCAKYPAFLNAIEFLTSKVPFMPTLGNHDYKYPSTRELAMSSFPVPGDINSYSFEIGNIRFQTVNFYDEVYNDAKDLPPPTLPPPTLPPPTLPPPTLPPPTLPPPTLPKKISWLQKDIKKRSPQIKWVIPFGHYPFYC
jgi:hypothetical protein